jgi:hypothetical protein
MRGERPSALADDVTSTMPFFLAAPSGAAALQVNFSESLGAQRAIEKGLPNTPEPQILLPEGSGMLVAKGLPWFHDKTWRWRFVGVY